MSYQDALKDFQKVQHLTYFEVSEHTSIADLCYLCLHELDLHAEQEYWHTITDRKALLKFCQKWGSHSTDGINYVSESQRMFDAGKNYKKSDCYLQA